MFCNVSKKANKKKQKKKNELFQKAAVSYWVTVGI